MSRTEIRGMTAEIESVGQGSKLRSHILYKALDAVVTAPLRVRRRRIYRLRQLLSPSSSNYDRVAAAVSVVDDLAPGTAGRWSGYLLDFGLLPLSCDLGQLYAYGSGSTVFLLERGGRPLILKVYRRSLGSNGPKLVQFARYCRQKYATVCRWYGDGQLNVLPAWHFILNAPLLGRPAVGMLQPFMGHEMRDFFLDFSDAALSALLESDAALREQVVFFCRRTLALAQHEGHCLDFVGRDNVTVVSGDRGRHELVILDYGLFELEAIERKAPATYERVVWRLERLEALLAMTEQRDVVEAKAAAGSRPQREARLD